MTPVGVIFGLQRASERVVPRGAVHASRRAESPKAVHQGGDAVPEDDRPASGAVWANLQVKITTVQCVIRTGGLGKPGQWGLGHMLFGLAS